MLKIFHQRQLSQIHVTQSCSETLKTRLDFSLALDKLNVGGGVIAHEEMCTICTLDSLWF